MATFSLEEALLEDGEIGLLDEDGRPRHPDDRRLPPDPVDMGHDLAPAPS
jgi:hypothetical protein